MKVIIAGAGIIGANVADSLAQEGHDVFLIERDEATAQKVDEKVNAKVIVGNAADPDTLRKVDVANADLMVSVTTSDETNLVVSLLAASLGAKRRLARVRNTSLGKFLAEHGHQKFSIDELINPEEVAAQAIVKTILTPGAREVADFAGGQILLRAFDMKTSSNLCGLKVEALRDEDFPWPFLIIAILRKGEVIIPKGDTVIEPGDRIYVLLPTPSLAEFLTFVDTETRMPQKVVIYGATDMGERVASALAGHISDILLLEEDMEQAEAVAGRLGSSVKVINGSALESEILTECGMEVVDVFIATSDDDQNNLVSAVLAKKAGAKKTIIIAQQPDYIAIVDALGIDAIINPRLLAVEQILRLVRGKGIQTVTKFMDCDAEAVELIPEEGSAVTQAPIKDIRFPDNTIVGAVYNESGVSLANGDTHIKEGDRVIVFCRELASKKLHQLFTHKKHFS